MSEIGIGHNLSAIDSAKNCFNALSALLAEMPVLVSPADATRATDYLHRSKVELEALSAAKDAQCKPLHEAWKEAVSKFSGPFDQLQTLRNELRKRLSTYLLAEEKKREEEARKAAWEAEQKKIAALDAEKREREAIENAAQGEFTDVGARVAEADQAFDEAKRAEHQAKIAERDATNVRAVGNIAPRAVGLRKTMVPTVENASAAVKAMWPHEGLRAAILTAARAYRRQHGEWPKGIGEIEEASV